MKIKITTLDNASAGEASLNPEIFGLAPRRDLLSRAVEWQRAKKQQGTHKTKLRGEVALTGKKPFKQKGTGNARQGSLKSAQHVGGAKAHGPVVRSHAYDLPKKIRKLALKNALSLKAQEGKLRVFDTVVAKGAKTKDIAQKFEKLGLKSVLFVRGDNAKDEFHLAVQNIPHADVIPQIGLNVFDILKHEELAITSHALKDLEERLK